MWSTDRIPINCWAGKLVRNNFSQFIFNHFKKNETYLHELNYLFWECTLRCNLQCLHCGSDCGAGIQVASVLADGSISACPNINRSFVQGNIYRDAFLDVWNNRFEIMRDRGWTKTGICENCDAYKNCGGGAMHLWDEKKDSIMTCIHENLLSQRHGGTEG